MREDLRAVQGGVAAKHDICREIGKIENKLNHHQLPRPRPPTPGAVDQADALRVKRKQLNPEVVEGGGMEWKTGQNVRCCGRLP